MDNTIPPVAINGNTPSGPAWFLAKYRAGQAKLFGPPMNKPAWYQALEASTLNDGDKETAAHLAEATGAYGVTAITNAQLAEQAGVSREATVSARLKRIQAAGLIETQYQFNKPALRRLNRILDDMILVAEDTERMAA